MRAALYSIPPLLLAAVAGATLPAVHIDIGLSGAIERVDDLDALLGHLERHLVWRVGADEGSPATVSDVRLGVLRIDRGRVTGSRQSGPVAASRESVRLAEALGPAALRELLSCCLHEGDPPFTVRALSGQAYLDAATLERAVAGIADRAIADGIFEIDPRVRLDWGRQFLLVVSAAAPGAVRTRPLILVFDRL